MSHMEIELWTINRFLRWTGFRIGVTVDIPCPISSRRSACTPGER